MENLQKLYIEMLEKVEKKFDLNKSKKNNITCMCHVQGKEYQKQEFKILYVGRAPNGWEINIKNATPEGIYKAAEKYEFTLEDIYTNPKIQNYNFNKSSFWQLIKGVIKKKSGTVENWSSKIAWTNLFKVAPYEGGNPKYKIMSLIFEDSLKILEEEIKILKPNLIVFVTDRIIDGFQIEEGLKRTFNIKFKSKENNFVIGRGIKDNRMYIVTKRPEFKNGTREEQVNQIMKEIE